jgi:UDPglucose 6-dehydrogenase
MKVTVFGSGYVGLVSGACLADVGNDVLCVDRDAQKIEMLEEGVVPIYEPGLKELITRNVRAKYLAFTTDMKRAVEHGVVQFIAVGTPPDEEGNADLQHVLEVAGTIGTHLGQYRVIVNKSTVPVGTADRVRDAIAARLSERRAEIEFDVVSNPEFLKEGAAINDFTKPERIVIGADKPKALALLRELYSPFNRSRDRMIAMSVRSAELTKYAANAMLATKITLMNELANIAEKVGADIEQVRLGIGSDQRIGYHFIYPGCGYGGSCLPKDVRALERSADTAGVDAKLLRAVNDVNDAQKQVLFRKVHRHFAGELRGRTFAVWGLSFKPNTDDMREAPSVVLMEALWEAGARVRAYDPEAMNEAWRIYGPREELVLCESAQDALRGADALVVVTEWKVFRSPDLEKLKALKERVVFDGRNLYDPQTMAREGLTYYAIGRGR